MSINNLINKFLKSEDLSQSSIPVYENVLLVFSGYFIENQCSLEYIDVKDIFRSLDYYIEERRIRYENTARFFISAVKEFLIYCSREEEIKNESLMALFGYGDNEGGFEDKVDKKINSLISNRIIKREQTGEEINSEEFKKLIKICNNIIDSFKIEDLNAKINNGKYVKYISALGLKIIAYTGIKVGLLLELRINNISEFESTLRIKNIKKNKDFTIKIPEKLCNQLVKYRDSIRYKLIKMKDKEYIGDYLFINFNCIPLKEQDKNIPFNRLLYEIIGKNKKMDSSTARISKRVIIDMISSGMSIKIIEDLTGYGDVVLGYCKEKVDEIKKEQKDPNKYIDKYLEKRNDENNYYIIFR